MFEHLGKPVRIMCGRNYPETYHLVIGQSTFCGRDASEWHNLESQTTGSDDPYLCRACLKKAKEVGYFQ